MSPCRLFTLGYLRIERLYLLLGLLLIIMDFHEQILFMTMTRGLKNKLVCLPFIDGVLQLRLEIVNDVEHLKIDFKNTVLEMD